MTHLRLKYEPGNDNIAETTGAPGGHCSMLETMPGSSIMGVSECFMCVQFYTLSSISGAYRYSMGSYTFVCFYPVFILHFLAFKGIVFLLL